MPKPARAARAAESVCGTLLDQAVCAQAGEVAAAEVEVGTDTRASAEYRRSLIRTYCPSHDPAGKRAGRRGPGMAPAALANAIEDALSPFGVKITELPLKAENIWRLLHP
jgi:carbon-monoxide dehydrogenase large subunit